MKVEALDRRNPTMVAPATIVAIPSATQVTVHFDGWSNTFDYTASIDGSDQPPERPASLPDIRCVGWCRANGVTLQDVGSRADNTEQSSHGVSWSTPELFVDPVNGDGFSTDWDEELGWWPIYMQQLHDGGTFTCDPDLHPGAASAFIVAAPAPIFGAAPPSAELAASLSGGPGAAGAGIAGGTGGGKSGSAAATDVSSEAALWLSDACSRLSACGHDAVTLLLNGFQRRDAGPFARFATEDQAVLADAELAASLAEAPIQDEVFDAIR